MKQLWIKSLDPPANVQHGPYLSLGIFKGGFDGSPPVLKHTPANDPNWYGPGSWLRRLPTTNHHQKKPWEWGPVIQQKSKIPGVYSCARLSQHPSTNITVYRQSFVPSSYDSYPLAHHKSFGETQCPISHSCQLEYQKPSTGKAGKLLSKTLSSLDSTGLRGKGAGVRSRISYALSYSGSWGQ